MTKLKQEAKKYLDKVLKKYKIKEEDLLENKAKKNPFCTNYMTLNSCNVINAYIAGAKSKEKEIKKFEWHYVKDGTLPKGIPYQNGTKAWVTVAYINMYNYPKKLDCYFWNNEFLCDSIYGYQKVKDVYGEVYAWRYQDELPIPPNETAK